MNKGKTILKEFLLPLLGQFGVLFVAILLHRVFIGLGPNILDPVQIGDEITKPTLGRLCYLIFAFIMFFVCAIVAMKNANKVYFSFFTGILSGTFLWQMLGEDMWHFGLLEHGEIVHFIRLESISVLPFLIPLVIFVVYCATRKNFNWGIISVLVSFFINWLGHYVSHGTYPIFQFVMTEDVWFQIAGCLFGSLIIIISICLAIFKAKTLKTRILCSALLYAGIAIVAFGFME